MGDGDIKRKVSAGFHPFDLSLGQARLDQRPTCEVVVDN